MDDAESMANEINNLAAGALAEDAQELAAETPVDHLPVTPRFRAADAPAYRVSGARASAGVNMMDNDVFSQIARALDQN